MLNELEKITWDNAFLAKEKGTSMTMKNFTLGKMSIHLVGIGSLVAWKGE